MVFTLGLAQVAHPADGDVIGQVRRYAQQAAERGVDLLVFPESLMGPWDAQARRYAHEPEPLDGPFCRAIDAIAAESGLWVVYTTEEANPADPVRPYNTAVIAGPDGKQRASYRKTHLYDAIGERESDRMTAGDTPNPVVETPFCRLGVAICYDLRFPEVARRLALAGAELVVYPSAWVAGPHKVEQWRTLVAARAIENECFVAGLSRTGGGRCGNSLVVDPLGVTLVTAGEEERLLTCDIEASEVARAREAMPVLEHRRPDLYAGLA